MLAATSIAAGNIASAAPSRAGERAYAIGDSVMLGAAPELQRLGITVDAVVSRQFVTGISIVQSLNAAGQLPSTVIVGLGTNGPFTAGQFDEMMQALHGVHLVYFITVKEPRFWEGQVNAALHAGVARWPNARLIDWYTAASAHPSWIYSDGIHLNPSGAVGYGQLIAAALAGASASTPPPAPSNLPADACVTQSSSWHLPGVIAQSVNLHGMVADQATQHLFVLSSVPVGPVGAHTCVSSLLTLDLKSGHVLHTTKLGAGLPASYHALVVDHPAHRLLLVNAGQLSPEGAKLPGSVSFFDTRTGSLLKTVDVGTKPSSIVVDGPAYRAYVLLHGSTTAGNSVAMLAVTRGVVLRTISQPVQKIAIDPSTGRLFLVTPTEVTTINAATGAIVDAIALPSLPAATVSDAVDAATGRLFVAQIDAAKPEASSITTIDARSGAVVHTITASASVTINKPLVDAPAGEVLTWGTGASASTATVIDARTGTVRGQIQLPLPSGGFRGPTVVDTHSGDIYGFTNGGIRAVRPGVTVPVRTVSTPSGTPIVLVMSGSAHRLYALLRNPGTGVRQFSVLGYCTSASCP